MRRFGLDIGPAFGSDAWTACELPSGFNVSSSFSATLDLTGLGLTSGDRFEIIVRAHSAAAGRKPAERHSQVVVVDLSPPIVGIVHDARKGCNVTTGSCDGDSREDDADVIGVSTEMHAWWGSFRDVHTAIASYQACLGSEPFACDLEVMTVPLQTTRHTFALGGVATHNQKFCVSVQAIDAVGLVSDRASSDCATVDATPPVMLHVGGGLAAGVHLEEQTYMDLAFANAQADDDLANIDDFEWCISSDGATCDKMIPTYYPPLARQTNATALGAGDLDLDAGSFIYFGARARSSVGLWSDWAWSLPTKVGSMRRSSG